jgi:hypothetical protein
VLTKEGKGAAYMGMLERPPVDTLQVMEPGEYLQGKIAPPLTIPDLDKIVAPAYERYDFGGMGAFDIYLLAKQYAPTADPKQYYSHWRGGYYLAVHAKSVPKDQIALIYLSRWDSHEAAAAFAKMYGDYVPIRYKGAERLPASCPVGKDEPECSVRQWDTSEGTVLLDLRGNDLLVLECLDDGTMQRARASLF